MADKLDPFDVEALERAVNDSATRVSAIWISFLIFSLYLLVAATTVTQRQLFLAEPVTLPVLNIALPLWGFFFLAPILFVILHIYVLLQVLLLGRTTAAYNAAVERLTLSPEENISLRQRLANTLFAQIFAGSLRERDGFVGWLLRTIVWITLAIAPILIVLAFQFSFLAYHSHIATWTHRLLIAIELAAFFLIWPLALDAQRDFEWPNAAKYFKRLLALPKALLGASEQRRGELLWLRHQTAPAAVCLLFVIFSLSIATFPGERHVNLFTLKPLLSVQCSRWLQQKFDLRFDRLILPQINVVDEDKFDKIVKQTSERKLKPSQGLRTKNFRDRDFNCSDLSSGDLRRVDLSGARLVGAALYRTAFDGASLHSAQLQGAQVFDAQLQDADLSGAGLQGADLSGARLQGAYLFDAQLQDAKFTKRTQLQNANLISAQLQGADLSNARLQRASLTDAQLQGASLEGAQLQGALLESAQLQGAVLDNAQLQGARLDGTQLQGARLDGTQLQGAVLDNAQLQGALLHGAQLQGASLKKLQLQGADFSDAILDHSVLSNVWTWRARNAACTKARVIDAKPDNAIDNKNEPISATPDAIAKFVELAVAEIPNASRKEQVAARMHTGLDLNPAKDDTEAIAKVWSDCEQAASKVPQEKFDKERAALLRNLVCTATESRAAIANGIAYILISDDLDERRAFSAQLAQGLLGQDGQGCAATADFDEFTLSELRAVAANPAL